MAVFPCDWSGHRYPGPQRSVYITSVFGQDQETCKLRLCQTHFRDFVNVCDVRLARIDGDSQVGQTCDNCQEDKSYAVYTKVFDQKEEPVYFAGDLCARCWQEVRVELKVASGRVLTAL